MIAYTKRQVFGALSFSFNLASTKRLVNALYTALYTAHFLGCHLLLGLNHATGNPLTTIPRRISQHIIRIGMDH